MKYLTSELAAIALLAIIIFSIQNVEAIDVSFLVGRCEFPRWSSSTEPVYSG